MNVTADNYHLFLLCTFKILMHRGYSSVAEGLESTCKGSIPYILFPCYFALVNPNYPDEALSNSYLAGFLTFSTEQG